MESLYSLICDNISEIAANAKFFDLRPEDFRMLHFDKLKYALPSKVSKIVTDKNFQEVREMVSDELFDYYKYESEVF